MSRPKPATPDAVPKRGALAAFLDTLERIGNRLPHPATLFVIMGVLVLVASSVAARFGVHAIHPKDGSTIAAIDLLNREGIRRIFTDAVKNFMGFAPLGLVLVAMLGIGVAEGTGLVSVALRAFVRRVPATLLTATVVFAGVNANLAADAGIIVLPPLAAMLFAAAGRHPLAGIAAAYAGVAGGFSANLFPSTLDVLLTSLSQEALNSSRLLPGYTVQVLGNYFFLAVSTPVLTIVGAWVTEKIVEPRLGKWEGAAVGAAPAAAAADAQIAAGLEASGAPGLAANAGAVGANATGDITPAERRGLVAAIVAMIATVGFFALLAVAPWGPLHLDEGDVFARLKPFFDSMVILIMALFFVPGLVYGAVAGVVRSDHDVAKLTSDTMSTMGTYIVIAFCAAQFVSWFGWSNLGAILSIRGAAGLRAMGLHDAPLLVAFILFAAMINLMIASASAKWAILAPVFVPMFVLLGFTPEATQVVYRIGDSSTNIITPLMPYMPFVLAASQRYVPRAGTGTLISMMLPYSIAFLVFWTLLLLAYVTFHWPIGPGVGFRLHP